VLHSAQGVGISGSEFTTIHGPQTTILIGSELCRESGRVLSGLLNPEASFNRA